MAPSTARRRTNNTSNSTKGSSTLRRRGGRQGQLLFGRLPAENDIVPLIPIDLDPTTRRADSEPTATLEPAPKVGKR